MVMAAGSVIRDPISGTAARPSHAVATEVWKGRFFAIRLTATMTV